MSIFMVAKCPGCLKVVAAEVFQNGESTEPFYEEYEGKYIVEASQTAPMIEGCQCRAELACLRAENKALQADAALVRAVIRIPDMAKLWHAESRWYLHPGDAPCLPLGTGNSLEAALQAAGLMEGEK